MSRKSFREKESDLDPEVPYTYRSDLIEKITISGNFIHRSHQWVTKTELRDLSLVDFFVNGPRCQEAVYKNRAFLSITMNSSHWLQIVTRVPVRVDKAQPWSPHQIYSNTPCLWAQQKQKTAILRRIVKNINIFLSLRSWSLTIKTKVSIRFFLAKSFYDIKCGRVMRNHDAFFFGILRRVVNLINKYDTLDKHDVWLSTGWTVQ